MKTKLNEKKVTPMPPEIEALRLAALSTRNPRKEKSKAEESAVQCDFPVANVSSSTNSPNLQPTSVNQATVENVMVEDGNCSEREEGELSDSDSINGYNEPNKESGFQHRSEEIEANAVHQQQSYQQAYIGKKYAEEELTRNLLSDLYRLSATPDDIIEAGIPVDVVIRFSREINYPLPPHLAVFSIPVRKPLTPTDAPVHENTSSNMLINSTSPSFQQHKSFPTSIPLVSNDQGVYPPTTYPIDQNTTFYSQLTSSQRDPPVESTMPAFSSVQYSTTQPSIVTTPSSPKEAYASRVSLNSSMNIVNSTQLPTSSPPKSQSGSIISNHQKPFLAPRETNYVIELSDESDNERITGLIKQVKRDIYPDSKLETEDEKRAQSDAKKKLEEKEREIKRMNELIASKMESLKKKVGPSTSITAIQDKVGSNSNAANAKVQVSPNQGISPPPDIATIRAELEIFENAKANLNEIRSKIEVEERELSDIRSLIKDQEQLESDYEKMHLNFSTQREELVNNRNALGVRRALIESQLADINRQIEDSNSSIISKEAEIEDVLSEKTKFITKKAELVNNEKTVSENMIQLKKQLSAVHKTIVAKKELLLKLVKPKNEAQTESSTVHRESNSTGKRTVSPEDATPRAVAKKAKLASSVSGDEVAQLSKRMEKVSKEHQELLQSLTLLNKRKGKKVVTSSTSNANASEADAEILYSNNGYGSPSDSAKSNIKENEPLNMENTELMDTSDSYTKKSTDAPSQVQDDSSFVPYESVLKGFRSYRFHPRYKKEIGKNGYKSIMYSRNYNVYRKMCVFESQNRGRCNDDECTSQHWRDLPMSDEELISDMASYYEGRTPTEQQEYRSGLEVLLNKLRAEGKTNVDEIIDAIVIYRQEFVSNNPFDNFEAPRIIFYNKKKPLGQAIDNEETSSAYDTGYVSESLPTPEISGNEQAMYQSDEDSESDNNNNMPTDLEDIRDPLYEMQRDTVEDMRNIDDIDYSQKQYHISQDSSELSSEHESSDSDEYQDGDAMIQDEQMYVDGESPFSPLHVGSPSPQQGEETPESQSTQTNNESSTGFSVMGAIYNWFR
ncbi:7580_t:CDS:2 [Gigaspora margarita]|uniref:7580_t:CDS:1 n=2 Tax=Gigaspora TaxID=4873 RepID=A0ABN7VFW5_GIGMA|nr:7580_t:CDS:2 [Gigaspora margarita]